MKKYVELQCDDLTMRGYLQGEGDSVIVMFHGFTGHKTESNGLFRYIADGLEKQNIPTLRFDWFGHGESDLHFEEITVPLLKKQGKIIIDYALEHFKTVYLL